MMQSHALGQTALTSDVVGGLRKDRTLRGAARRARTRRAEEREFKVTVALLTVTFLPITTAAKVLPASWRPFGGSSARVVANEIAPFMLSR